MPVLVRYGTSPTPSSFGHRRPAAGVDEDLRRLEQPVVDADRARALEAAVALDQRHVRRVAQPVRHAAVRLRDDLVLARLDPRHVDADRTVDHDAEVAGAACDVGGPRARDQRLGRNAADVDARAADALALEDRRLAARRREPHGQRRTCLPGADDDRVEALGHASTPSPVRGPAAPQRAPRYAVARRPLETGSWITTPSIGSTGAVHGARSTMRFVSAYPACQRARMPAGVKSMSFV